jgi:hypothetical protein
MHRLAFTFAFALAACGDVKPAAPDAGPIEESAVLGTCAVRCGPEGGSGTWAEAGDRPASTCCDCRRSFAEVEAEACFSGIDDDVVQCPECNDLP